MKMETPLKSRRILSAVLFSLFLALIFILAPAARAEGDTTDASAAPQPGLQPGVTTTYRQTVPVNIVLVGYDKGDVNLANLQDSLPDSYQPIVRYPAFYGVKGRNLGLDFRFRYNVQFAGRNFEDDFFGYLSSIAVPMARTVYQEAYNEQDTNVLDIPETVWGIDGPSAEGWLLNNAARLGINPNKSYTVFLVNWFDRPDFQFHVYTKTDFVDPDTGFAFGTRSSRKMIAWGGTHGRAWLYDLSAGPESWTANWIVDFEDLDEDGVVDYRMPPIWEYRDDGYRPLSALGSDLGKVVRYVAINLLFTASPLYDPLASSPGPDGNKVTHVEVFELDGQRAINGVDYFDKSYITDELASFQPYYQWQTVIENNRFADTGSKRALQIASGNRLLKGCWKDYGTTFAQLFCHFNRQYSSYVPLYGPQDYVVPNFAYHATDYKLGTELGGLLGFADDNWVDGTPSYVFSFLTSSSRAFGYGFSTTTVHEDGHHIGLSHPHDGYDSELGLDYGPEGSLFFAWSGDSSNTVMSYIDLSGDFGVFDQDNMNRYIFAGYLNWSNDLLAKINAHPGAGSVATQVAAAQQEAKTAQAAFNQWQYAAAALHARHSYEAIGRAAMQLNIPTRVTVETRGLPLRNDIPKIIDPIRFEDGN